MLILSDYIGVGDSETAFLTAADVLIIFISINQLLFQIFKFWRRGLQYLLDLENWLALVIDVLSIAFVLYHLGTDCHCADNKHIWMVEVIAVFLVWISFIVFLRRVPITGITISIMYNIFTTFIGLIFIAALLIFAFALPFYMSLVIPVS